NALEARRTQRPQREVSFDQASRAFGDYGCTRIGQGLHPRGQVGSMTPRCVLGLTRSGSTRSYYHLPGVHPDPNLNWRAAVGAQLLSVAANFFLHAQRRVQGALRMVLVRVRRAEQREDAVAG